MGPRIDALRFRDDFEALSQAGATPEGGVSRPTFSDAHFAARRLFRDRAEAAGLETSVDGAGNHSAILRSPRAEGDRRLLLGSHLDSVPGGGRFDGALGVVAALNVLHAVRDAGLELPVHLEAVDFTDEEGTLVGLLGSEALAGVLEPEALRSPRGSVEALCRGMGRAGLTEESVLGARRDPSSLAGYLELHIEQGLRLERAGVQIGVVTGIVGARSFLLAFEGHANHAGTTPMEERRDAGAGAASFLLGAREIAMRDFPGAVATVGQMRLEPGAFNVVPGRAEVALEFRSLDAGQLDAMEAALLARAREDAERFGLGLAVEPVARWAPTPLDPGVQGAVVRAAESLRLSYVTLASGAGHDAQALARVCPSGMVFVPSVGGVSHDPRELTRWEDCLNGANVFLLAALDLVGA